jgi:hypothetical protein
VAAQQSHLIAVDYRHAPLPVVLGLHGEIGEAGGWAPQRGQHGTDRAGCHRPSQSRSPAFSWALASERSKNPWRKLARALFLIRRCLQVNAALHQGAAVVVDKTLLDCQDSRAEDHNQYCVERYAPQRLQRHNGVSGNQRCTDEGGGWD